MTEGHSLNRIILTLVLAVLVLPILSGGCLEWDDGSYRNKVTYTVEEFENNYVITVTAIENQNSFSYLIFSLKDSKGKLLFSENLRSVQSRDPRFLEEDLTPQPLSVVYHDNDQNGAFSVNDTLVLWSSENGGLVDSNMVFTLRHGRQDSDEHFMKVRLPEKSDITVRTISPHRDYPNPNNWVVNESSSLQNSNLSILIEHVVFSSFISFKYEPLSIGVTLSSNSSEPLENLSVTFSDRTKNETVLLDKIENITVAPHTKKRIVINTLLPDRRDDWFSSHNVTFEVVGDNLASPLKGSAKISQIFCALET